MQSKRVEWLDFGTRQRMARIWSSGFEMGDFGDLEKKKSVENKKMNISAWIKRQDSLVKLIALDDRYKEILDSVVRNA